MVEVKLTGNSGGSVALIDDADASLVMVRKWCRRKTRHTSYAVSSLGSGKGGILLHVLLLGTRDGFTIDHVNGNGLDNRRQNLRWATSAEQSRNRPNCPLGRSGYRGVTWHPPTERWKANINFDGSKKHLGLFHEMEAAALARDFAAQVLYGEFAVLNFPNGRIADPGAVREVVSIWESGRVCDVRPITPLDASPEVLSELLPAVRKFLIFLASQQTAR